MMTPQKHHLSDLPAEVFLLLCKAFYEKTGGPKGFNLRDKRNTQDDPLDEYIHKLLAESLPPGTECLKAPGPLITPDFVVMRRKACQMTHRKTLATDLTSIVGVEVKKLERTPAGTIARASGMDYNTTPPCGKIRVYDMGGTALDIRGFYLFVCQEPFGDRLGCYCLSALTLCDGNMLNADFEYYLSIVGERTKEIGVGSYGNGANRSRPMLIFANPLGVPQLDKSVTLIHPSMHLEHEFPEMKRIGTVRRTVSGKNIQAPFWCYRFGEHVSSALTPFDLLDPFLTPTRTEKTQPRGRFRVNLHLAD